MKPPVNVSMKDHHPTPTKRGTLKDAELENLPLPNLSEPSSILSPALLREVRKATGLHSKCIGLNVQCQIF